jgi:hypothetical protein
MFVPPQTGADASPEEAAAARAAAEAATKIHANKQVRDSAWGDRLELYLTSLVQKPRGLQHMRQLRGLGGCAHEDPMAKV